MRLHPLFYLSALVFPVLAFAPAASAADTETARRASITFEASIALENVSGRIDHLAVDLEHRRIFIAELGNGSVDVVDVDARAPTKRITGLSEPQGVAYSNRTQVLYVATGGDGVLHSYSGVSLQPAKSVTVGADADNVRIDDVHGRIYVAFDEGIAVIDPATLQLTNRITLKAHPESFQLHSSGNEIIANVPEANQIAVVDVVAHKQIASWRTGEYSANFPLVLDASGQKAIVGFRQPSGVGVYDIVSGKLVQSVDACGDADDLFLDEKRGQLYVSCGTGFIDVFDTSRSTFLRAERITTRAGARTSLYVPEWGRLFVAARASAQEPAAILIYQVRD